MGFFILLGVVLGNAVCTHGQPEFFRLALAVAISLLGLHSGAALASMVEVVVEVLAMRSLVAIVNRTRW